MNELTPAQVIEGLRALINTCGDREIIVAGEEYEAREVLDAALGLIADEYPI